MSTIVTTQSSGMSSIRLSLPTVLAIAIIVGAGAFAAGRSTSTQTSSTSPPAPEERSTPHVIAPEPTTDLPPGHPPMIGTGTTGAMPPGHPAVGDMPGSDPMSAPAPAAAGSFTWKAPPRWKEAPNTSSMRLATYKIPGPEGEAEVSVSQAGGSIEANAARWIGQFDAAAQKSAKQTKKKIAGFDVTFVEVQGTYSGGMNTEGGGANMALLGAIVATPDMPHFFKITGPAKTVTAAHAELEQLLATLAAKP